MPRLEEEYAFNHRRQQSLVFVLSLVALLFAIAPRQERALFITKDIGLKGFGATFPPIIPATFLNFPDLFGPSDGTPAAFFARTPPLPGGFAPVPGSPGGGPGAGGPVTESPDAGTAFTPPAQPAGPGAGGPIGNGGNLPFVPNGGGPTTSSPVVPTADSTPVPVPTDTPTPVPVVPAVPEPATWLSMILGFAIVGSAFRQRRLLSRWSGRVLG